MTTVDNNNNNNNGALVAFCCMTVGVMAISQTGGHWA